MHKILITLFPDNSDIGEEITEEGFVRVELASSDMERVFLPRSKVSAASVGCEGESELFSRVLEAKLRYAIVG